MAGADVKRVGRSIVRSQRDVILEGGKLYMSRAGSLSLVSDNKQIEIRSLGSIAICTY